MNFHKDNVIKIDYNPVLDAQIDYANAVGATDSLTLRTLDFTPSDANTIFVKKTGNDSTAVGTQADPVLTIKKAESLITATKTNIVILDDGVYEEESLAFDTNCANIAAAIGKKPTVKPVLVPMQSVNYSVDILKATTAIGPSNGQNLVNAELTNGNFAYIYHDYSTSLYYGIKDKDGNTVVSNTLLTSTSSGSAGLVGLEDGHFVIVWRSSNSGINDGYYIFSNDGILNSSGNLPNSGNRVFVGKVGEYNDRFVLCYTTASGVFFIIKDTENSSIVGPVLMTSNISDYYFSIAPRPGGGFIFAFKIYDTYGHTWGVVNGSGSVLHEGQISSAARYPVCIVNDDNITFAFRDDSGNILLKECSSVDYSTLKSEQIILASAGSLTKFARVSICNARDGSFALSGLNSGTNQGTLIIVSSNWDILYRDDSFTVNGAYFDCSYNTNSDRLFLTFESGTAPYFQIKGCFLTDWWTFSSSISFNGISFDNEENFIKKYLYSSAGTLKFKWCTFENIARINYNDSDRYPLYICEASVTAAEILNCEVFSNNAGFKITSNSVQVKNCQFFKQLLDQALYIIGSGTGIIISHNDFLYNYICIELEDNAGTEVIKNNIFYTSLLYAIKAEAAVTYSNSVENCVSLNATPGAQVIRSNPHYVNDGYVTLNDMNLTLKSRELGYRFESPAIGIGDDLKNAGSLEYSIADGSQTWTTITVQKDRIGRGYDPVGNIETVYKDGSVESYRDSYTEVLKLDWRVAINDDFDKLIALYFASSNLVRIYLDPISDPGVYGTYVLVYDKVNAATELPKLSRTGKQSVSLTFKRAYNEGD